MPNNVIYVTLTFDLGIDADALRRSMESIVNKTVDAFEKDFKSSVEHFNTKPIWSKQTATWHGKIVEGSFGTSDPNYVRLSEGTTAHSVGTGGQLMSFRGWPWRRDGNYPPTYQPKTQPGRIASTPGGPISGTVRRVARGPWQVKAIEPRRYDELIVEHNRPYVDKLLDDVFKSASKPK